MALQSGTLALSVTAAALSAGPCREVSIHNNDGAINVLVGNSTAQNYSLGAGQTVKLAVANRNQVWLKSASATPTVSWIST